MMKERKAAPAAAAAAAAAAEKWWEKIGRADNIVKISAMKLVKNKRANINNNKSFLNQCT